MSKRRAEKKNITNCYSATSSFFGGEGDVKERQAPALVSLPSATGAHFSLFHVCKPTQLVMSYPCTSISSLYRTDRSSRRRRSTLPWMSPVAIFLGQFFLTACRQNVMPPMLAQLPRGDSCRLNDCFSVRLAEQRLGKMLFFYNFGQPLYPFFVAV